HDTRCHAASPDCRIPAEAPGLRNCEACGLVTSATVNAVGARGERCPYPDGPTPKAQSLRPKKAQSLEPKAHLRPKAEGPGPTPDMEWSSALPAAPQPERRRPGD